MLRQAQPDLLSTKRSSQFLQPALAWLFILGFALFSTGLILVGAGNLLNLAFPLGAFAVGVFLYLRYPILYLGFSWWILFLTPLVRRLADYHSGFTDPSPILLSPFLVILVTLATLYKQLPKIHRQGGLPFIFSFAGLFYGLFIGLVQAPPVHVIKSILEWLTPVLLGFHIFTNWREYPKYRQNLQTTFVWGVLVTGVYGVFQYITAPQWDRFWLINTELLTAGIPEPLGIRVWSTMNAPLVFAIMMMAGLLLLFTYSGFLRIPASIFGYLAFLLSLVRTAWGGWIVGLAALIASLKPSLKMRLIITLAVMALCVIPLTTIEPFSGVINSRFDSISNLEHDGSSLARQRTYAQLLTPALTSFVGYGFGNVPNFGVTLDSVILSSLFTLGWLGSILYLGGWLLLSFELFRGSTSHLDPFISTARAVVLSGFFMLPLGPVMIGLAGSVLWGFLGIGMAARKYHLHQRQKLR